jgi:hypothetical protein
MARVPVKKIPLWKKILAVFSFGAIGAGAAGDQPFKLIVSQFNYKRVERKYEDFNREYAAAAFALKKPKQIDDGIKGECNRALAILSGMFTGRMRKLCKYESIKRATKEHILAERDVLVGQIKDILAELKLGNKYEAVVHINEAKQKHKYLLAQVEAIRPQIYPENKDDVMDALAKVEALLNVTGALVALLPARQLRRVA